MTVREHIHEALLYGRIFTHKFRRPPQKVGWLVGSGRSGTTWLASLVNADATMRELFEPVHKLHVPHMKEGPDHPYLRNGEVSKEWAKWQSDVFQGRYITCRTDRDNIYRNPANARKLLVKDVFACGMVGAGMSAHPKLATALVMRHPIAVALSKQVHRDWHWTWSPRAFMDEPKLVEDHLSDVVDDLERISREGSELANLVAVWAVLQRLALRSAPQERMPILHYERAVLDPWGAVKELGAHPSWEGIITANEEQVLSAAKRISFVSKAVKLQSLPNPARWKNKVDSPTMNECALVLKALGMEGWHNHEGFPEPEVIQAWRDAQTPPLT